MSWLSTVKIRGIFSYNFYEKREKNEWCYYINNIKSGETNVYLTIRGK